MIALHAGPSRVDIAPDSGGGLAGCWVGGQPVLRPWSGKAEEGPFALSCNLLVPFSNRLSNGGFVFDGEHYLVGPNLPGEACAIHGDGFQRPWTIADVTGKTARLTLSNGEIGPFRYAANVKYSLASTSLDIRLSVTNRAEKELPFGIGIHPWFPRSAATRLRFEAEGEWPESPDHLPATRQPVPLKNGGHWRGLNPLPDGWINTCFEGWYGRGEIEQGAEAVSVRLTATGLNRAMVYSPSGEADFFCFEPVSHPVDAHNLPNQPGLVRLAPGETMTAGMTLEWMQNE